MDFNLRRITWVVAIVAFICMGSCNSVDDCFRGTGDIIKEVRNTGFFNRIQLRSNVDVIVHKDSVQRITITAGENLLKGIQTINESGVLKISNTNACNWVRKLNPQITVDVYTPEILSIFCEDATGNILFADTMESNEFRLDSYASMGSYRLKLKNQITTLALHNGPADLVAYGITQTLYQYNAGFGELNCESLKSAQCYATNKGTNNSYLYATEILEVKIEYNGNIYYRGNPANIIQTVKGNGRLIHF